MLVPVGAAVVLAAGGFGLSQIGHGPGSQGTASTAAGAAQATSAAKSADRGGPAAAPFSPVPSARSQEKPAHQPVAVSRATLRQHVLAELRLPPALRPTKAETSRVLACVHRLAGTAPLELVESALFNGQPATIIVARTGRDDTAWVAGPGCSATSGNVLDTITVPPGISEP